MLLKQKWRVDYDHVFSVSSTFCDFTLYKINFIIILYYYYYCHGTPEDGGGDPSTSICKP